MLGEALRLIRVFHDCKASELAKELDMSASYLSEIEKGDKTPSLEVIKKYADYFNISPSAIMFFGEGIGGIKPGRNAIRKKLIKFMQIIENATR